VKAKVIQITEDGWNVEMKNSVNGIVRKEQTGGAVANIGDVVDAIVLDVDGTENTVYLSARTELVESADNDKENRMKLVSIICQFIHYYSIWLSQFFDFINANST